MVLRMPLAWEKNKEPIAGFVGAGTGLFAGELVSEFAVRVTGQTGYKKAGMKTAVKGLLGGLLFATGVAAGGAWGIMWKAFAFSNWGSTVLDWIFAVYPGGVFGMAERMAVTVRTWAMGAKKVSAELAALERGIPTTPKGAPAAKIGKY